MKKKFLIFDFDGVIVDSTMIGFRKINKNLSGLNLPEVSENFLRKHWGKKADDLFSLVCEEVGASQEKKENFKMRDAYMLEEYALSSEVVAALSELQETNYIGLLTSRTDNSLYNLANKIGLDLNMFDFIQTADRCSYTKPDGSVFKPLLEWVRALGFAASDVVYFGDTIDYDYAATQNCQPRIDFVGVASGVNTVRDFLNAGLGLCQIVPYFTKLPWFLSKVEKQEKIIKTKYLILAD